MTTRIMTTEQLETTIINGRWFAGFKARWKKLGTDSYRVTTNYVPAGVR
jgi:hypothetical protein